jgi:hypothetical protein
LAAQKALELMKSERETIGQRIVVTPEAQHPGAESAHLVAR